MAIPGMVVYSLVGVTGQVITNALDNWRVRYVFEHEHEWEREKVLHKTADDRDELARRFEFLGRWTGVKQTPPEKRIRVLRDQIGDLEEKIKNVDEEIAKWESTKTQGK
jgi:hypothetical protein